MYALDLVAAALIAAGAFLGAGKGLWRMVAGGCAVSLGAFAGILAYGVLAAALADLGVGYPGDALLGFLLPFALVSVYTRYILGLWLSRKLGRRPGRNRRLGAVAGAVWVAFALGSLGRSAGIGQRDRDVDAPRAEASRADASRAEASRAEAPFCSWLSRYPGALAPTSLTGLRPASPTERASGRSWKEALAAALDGGRIQARAAEADGEARSSIRAAVEARLAGEDAVPRSAPVRLRAP